MAWLTIDQSLSRHPKIFRLSAVLQVGRSECAGKLVFLWLWAMDYTEGGQTAIYSTQEIADASDWSGDPATWHDALKACHWLDVDGTIHNWHKYAGGVLEDRKHDAARKRENRKKLPSQDRNNVPRTVPGRPDYVVGTSENRPPHETVQYIERKKEEGAVVSGDVVGIAEGTTENWATTKAGDPATRIPTVAEVSAYGQMVGVPPLFAAQYHSIANEQHRWVSRGKLILWQMELKRWWERDREKWRPHKRHCRSVAEILAELRQIPETDETFARRSPLYDELALSRKLE